MDGRREEGTAGSEGGEARRGWMDGFLDFRDRIRMSKRYKRIKKIDGLQMKLLLPRPRPSQYGGRDQCRETQCSSVR